MDLDLSPENRQRLTHMIALHRHWTAWQQARVAVLLWAGDLTRRRVLTVDQACQALQMSQANWYRNMRALRPVRGSQTERDAVAAIDRALREAGADDSTTLADVKASPDLELALATIGVQHRITETENT